MVSKKKCLVNNVNVKVGKRYKARIKNTKLTITVYPHLEGDFVNANDNESRYHEESLVLVQEVEKKSKRLNAFYCE